MNKTTPQQTIKVTIVGGYLGSGKTTLINHMIGQHDLSDCLFLINDFGAFNIDADLIASQGVNTIELKNGCVCCSMANGLTVELLKIIRGSKKPERIVIEASGVANPAKIRDLVELSKSLKLEQVIVLVDANRIQATLADKLVGDTVQQQLSSADTLVLNKIDCMDENSLDEIRVNLEQQAPMAKLVCTEYARLPARFIFKDCCRQYLNKPKSDEPPSELSFQSWSFQSNGLFNRTELEQLLESLPSSIQRVKGFVVFADEPEQAYLLQWVPGEWSHSTPVKGEGQSHKIELNLIGNSECYTAMIEDQLKLALQE